MKKQPQDTDIIIAADKLKAELLTSYGAMVNCLQGLDADIKSLLQSQFELDEKWWEAGKNDKR